MKFLIRLIDCCCRFQRWSSDNQESKVRTDCRVISEVNKQDKPIPSCIQSTEQRYRTGQLRPNKFLEDRRWPPREEILKTQFKEQKIPTSSIWVSAVSQNFKPLPRWNCIDSSDRICQQKSSFISENSRLPLHNLDHSFPINEVIQSCLYQKIRIPYRLIIYRRYMRRYGFFYQFVLSSFIKFCVNYFRKMGKNINALVAKPLFYLSFACANKPIPLAKNGV